MTPAVIGAAFIMIVAAGVAIEIDESTTFPEGHFLHNGFDVSIIADAARHEGDTNGTDGEGWADEGNAGNTLVALASAEVGAETSLFEASVTSA